MNFKPVLALSLFLMPFISYAADSQGKVVIVPLAGFDSNTAVSPVGGNNKLTVGGQRLEVFERAAFIWSNILDLHYDITVEATFAALTCSASSATLGYAGPNRVKKDNNVWYGTAQANQILKTDTSDTFNDIYATFNSSIDAGCFNGASSGWYYGLDNNEPSDKEALLDVVLHEIGHGLGFLSFVDLSDDTSATPAVAATGALFNSYIDSYSRFLKDHTTNKIWADMSNAERLASRNNNTLIWTGSNANAGAMTNGLNELSSGFNNGGIKMHAPSSYSSGSSVSHISTDAAPNQLMEPYNTDDGIHPVLEIQMFKDMGYDLKADLSANSQPMASNYTLSIPVNGSINLAVLSHATDADTDAIFLHTFKDLPTNGSLSDNFDANATYTPSNNFTGSDSIVYQVYDDHMQLSNEATITINVANTTAPTASDDSANLNEDSINYSINVLANDIAESNALDSATLALASQGLHGSASIISGEISYTPIANYYGTDTLSYHVKDSAGLQSNTATLTLTISNVDDAAISSADSFTIAEDSSGNTLDLINNDSDIDSTLNNNQVIIVSQPQHGSAIVNVSGAIYTPDPNYYGSDGFTYKLSVDGKESNISTVAVSISNTNDAPVSNSDSYSINNTDTLLDVLLNDIDIDHALSELQIIIESQPSHGIVTVNSGSINYQVNNGYAGGDSFSYSLKDAANASSNTSNVDLQITNAVLPIAVADAFVFDEDSRNKSLPLTSNDNFVGGITQISISQQPENGHISIDGLNVLFTAHADVFGQSTFSYRITDQTDLQSKITTGRIMLINKNDAPQAVSDSLTVVSGLSNKLKILSNDTDESLVNVTINIMTKPLHGGITIKGNKVYYRLNDVAQSQDSFSYSITDNEGLTSNTVAVTLSMDNQLPLIDVVNDEFVLKISTSKQLDVLKNDTTYTDSYTLNITQQASKGELSLNGTILSYTADDSADQDSFKYTLTDEQGQTSDEATVVIEKSNTTPLKAYDDRVEVEENESIYISLTNNDEFENIRSLTLYRDAIKGEVTKVDNHQVSYQTSNQDDSFVYAIEDDNFEVQYAQVYITLKKAAETTIDDSILPGDDSLPNDDLPAEPEKVIDTTPSHKSGGGAMNFLLLLLIVLSGKFTGLRARV
jgi:hypothetical protein